MNTTPTYLSEFIANCKRRGCPDINTSGDCAIIINASCTQDCSQDDLCTCANAVEPKHVYPLPEGAKPLKFAPGVIQYGSSGRSIPKNFTDSIIFIALISALVLLYFGTAVLAGFIARSLGLV